MGKEEEEGARAVVKHSSSGKRKALCLEPTDSGRASQQDDVSSDSSREECKHFSFTPMEMYGFIDTIKYFNRIPQCNDCWREFTAGQQLALEESKSCFMVCSGCSQCFCTGSKTNEDWPMGHARPHANNSTCHPIALSIDHSDTAYCFQCDQSLNIKTWCSASLAQSSHKYGYVFRGIPNLLDQNLVQCLLWLDQIWMSQAGPFATAGSPGVVLKELFMKKLFIQKLLESLGVYNVRSGTFALQNSQKSNLHLHRLIEKLVKRPPDVRKDFSTVLDSNLQGRMSTTWTCKRCLHTAYENEAFYELRLTLPPKEHPIKTSALPEKSVTFSRAALMTNLRQLGKEEERKQASLPSIKKCLEYYFGKKVVVKRCEICEKTSTSISKDGGQMAANMNESASLDKDQTECHHKGKVDEKSDLLSAHENEKANQVGDGQNKQTDMGGYADKELFLSKLPTVLTLRVLRFKNNDKRTEHVKFEENLDVGEYMDLRSEDKDNTRYRLLRVIQHIGSSLAEGHCIAYLRGNRIASEQERSSSSYSWFCFDDLHARVLSLDEILEQEAWLLFYERIED